MSGEFIVKDQPAFEGTDVFALPPAAFDTTGANKRSSKTAAADHLPASPAASPEFMALGRSTNTRQQTSGTKRPLEDFDLPPPPTRTRKIIQMKPKTQQSPSTKSGQASGGKAAKDSGKTASSSDANANAAVAPASGNKKKQPTATSAAGRKIARKTAHSLIERRRRSKMNEEFTTLKDMIPACTGQEMHKLAILQVNFSPCSELDSGTDSKKGKHRLCQLPGTMHQRSQDCRRSGTFASPPRSALTNIPRIPRRNCRQRTLRLSVTRVLPRKHTNP